MLKTRKVIWFCVPVLAVAVIIFVANAATTVGSLTFTNTPLTVPNGSSEPAISIGLTGTTAATGLGWLDFGTNFWTGTFSSTPTFQGKIDSGLQRSGKRIFGGGDADVDIGSTGTLHASTLIFLVNPPLTRATLGVSAITCLSPPTFDASNCTKQILDFAGADRQWITSEGSRVYISYHDAGNSTIIRVQRSDDDGLTWTKVASPIPGQGRITADATFNNTQGPIVADPVTHNVYDIYTAGEPGIQKATSANHNNVFVTRSTNFGKTWTPTLLFHAPLFTPLNNVFPTLAVDPTNGNLYTSWSDAHSVFFSTSTDQGRTWSTAVVVNIAPANTAIFPWLAAHGGIVDLVYYATDASSIDVSTAVWNVYLAQTTDHGATFTQSRVSNTPNHVGVVCTQGIACAPGTRNLLDLFEVAINPGDNRAAVVYTDDTLTKTTQGAPLPQIVYAQQN
jgi:hypothetical protein